MENRDNNYSEESYTNKISQNPFRIDKTKNINRENLSKENFHTEKVEIKEQIITENSIKSNRSNSIEIHSSSEKIVQGNYYFPVYSTKKL